MEERDHRDDPGRGGRAALRAIPFTAGLTALVAALSVIAWCQRDYGDGFFRGLFFATPDRFGPVESFLAPDAVHVWRGRVWSLATASLVQADPAQLLFVVWAFRRYAAAAERLCGPALAALFWLAASSSAGALELFIADRLAPGLGGTAFAVAAFAARRSLAREDWRGLVQRRETYALLSFLVLCFVATAAGVAPVANWAHVGGAAFGVAAAEALEPHGLQNIWVSVYGTFVVFALSVPFYDVRWSATWNQARALRHMEEGDARAALPRIERARRGGLDPAWCVAAQSWCYGKLGLTAERAVTDADLSRAGPAAERQLEAFASGNFRPLR
jgi:membrane associated rhomboid family serine protease